jgi:hypothetical protein
VTRLVADSNLSRHFIKACRRLEEDFPIVHIADWLNGRHSFSKDPVLLGELCMHRLVIVTFDRRTMAMHAGELTRAGRGHAGVVLFRRTVSQVDYGRQSRLLIEFWKEASDWDWTDRIEYLPRT